MDDLRYFIRNDDVGARTPALENFVETFIGQQLPVSYQVIPEKLTRDCAAWLRRMHAAHPNLIEFGQHGLRHEMTIRGKRLWREFGPERSYAQQRADISRGKALLEDALGTISLFTPPQHKYDRNTLRALERSCFRCFSAAAYPALPHRFVYAAGRAMGWSAIHHHGLPRHGGWRDDAQLFELSISIPVDNGGRIVVPPRLLAASAAHAARVTNRVGFMMHHHVYSGQSEMLAEVAATMRSLNAGQFALLSSLVS